VARHIRGNPEEIQEVLCVALDRTELEDRQFQGLAIAAIMAGGSSLLKLPTLVKTNPDKVPLLKAIQGPL